MKLIHEAPTIALREDLEKELEILVKKMEAKAEQISKIKRHQARVSHFVSSDLVPVESSIGMGAHFSRGVR